MPDSESAIRDRLGRPLRDLRISVTDRCNFRCEYCMPQEAFGRDHRFLPRRELLSFEEIARLARVFADLGVRKFRITGGEPLLRRDLEILIAKLAAIHGVEDIALTTNGTLLTAAKARALRRAGLRRVTVSMDSLDDAVARTLNPAACAPARVLEAIDAAQSAGLGPVKVNMVVVRGINENDILPMARHFRATGQVLRYIEYMDVGGTNGWSSGDVIPARRIVATIHREFPLEAIGPDAPGSVAQRWRYRDGVGEIGVIPAVSQPFCRGCNRARLSAEGRLYTCLFAQQGEDLKRVLRSGAGNADLRAHIATLWARRSDRYSEERASGRRRGSGIEMSYIGG